MTAIHGIKEILAENDRFLQKEIRKQGVGGGILDATYAPNLTLLRETFIYNVLTFFLISTTGSAPAGQFRISRHTSEPDSLPCFQYTDW